MATTEASVTGQVMFRLGVFGQCLIVTGGWTEVGMTTTVWAVVAFRVVVAVVTVVLGTTVDRAVLLLTGAVVVVLGTTAMEQVKR